MNKEDFDSEVNALFEEDSVLAQAVIDLQQRRSAQAEQAIKENTEAQGTESESSEASDVAVREQGSDAVKDASAAETSDSLPADDPDVSEDAQADDTAPSSADAKPDTITEANGAEVLPEKDAEKRKKAPRKKNKKPEKASGAEVKKRNRKPIASTVELLEFVSGENTVRPESDSALFDFGFALDEADTDADTEGGVDISDSDQINADAADGTSAAQSPEEPSEPEAEPNAPAEPEELQSEAEAYTASEPTVHQAALEYSESHLSALYEDIPADIGGYGDSPVYITAESLSIPDIEAALSHEAEEHEGEDGPIANDLNTEDGGEFPESVADAAEAERYAVTDLDEQSEKKPAEKSRFIDGVFDFLELFIFSLAAVLLITTFFFRHSVVEGGSMEQTLFDGEHIIISKLFYEPKRGDIIVCEDYSLDNEYYHKPLVKRIIGIPGDTVVIIYNKAEKRSSVYVNGERLDEDYVYIDSYPEYRNDTGKWVVGEGEVFVMGDHRNNSSDSRDIGCIRIDSIIGKALVRFYPFDKFGKIE